MQKEFNFFHNGKIQSNTKVNSKIKDVGLFVFVLIIGVSGLIFTSGMRFASIQREPIEVKVKTVYLNNDSENETKVDLSQEGVILNHNQKLMQAKIYEDIVKDAQKNLLKSKKGQLKSSAAQLHENQLAHAQYTAQVLKSLADGIIEAQKEQYRQLMSQIDH